METTVGTKMPEILSARRAAGALRSCASVTRRSTCEMAVLPPTPVASMRSIPSLQMVPPETWEPTSLYTGRLSPVSIDSSTEASPDRTVPSTGIREPGLTMTIFFSRTFLAGISTSCPSLRRMAVFGIIETSESIACLAEFLLFSSRYFPSSTSATTTAADSK